MTDSAWKKYKKERSPKVWDLLNPKIKHVDKIIQQQRLAICLDCPQLIKSTKTCKLCGCFMTQKVKLPHASCPLLNWSATEVENGK